MKKHRWIYIVVSVICVLLVAGLCTVKILSKPVCVEKNIYFFMSEKSLVRLKGEPKKIEDYSEMQPTRILTYKGEIFEEKAKVFYKFYENKLSSVHYSFEDVDSSVAMELCSQTLAAVSQKYNFKLSDFSKSSASDSNKDFSISFDEGSSPLDDVSFSAEYTNGTLDISVYIWG